jgi:ABC-type uncharacterized transport system auxiliary subunit
MRRAISQSNTNREGEVTAMNRWKKSAVLVSAAAILSLLSGCGAARPSKYYQLTPPSDSAGNAAQNPFALSLVLGPLYTSHLYREDRIVYSSESQQMGTYETERWSEPPVEMFRDVLLRKLRESGRYRDVNTIRTGGHGDFIIKGRLYDFKEVTGKSFAGRLAFDLEMHDAKTNMTVWTHTYNHDEPVSGKDVAAVVAALDRNVQRATTEVAASLEQYFSAHPQK